MLTDEQRYLFDLQGFLRVEGVLDAEHLRRLQSDMLQHGIVNPDNNPSQSRFNGFFAWSDAWRELIDHPKILPLLVEIVGPKIRMHHAYGMAMSTRGQRGGEGLHHYAGLFNEGIYYATHGSKMHNGLIVVSYALCDVPRGSGGFCCIPGSHKAIYPTPQDWFAVADNPLVVQPALKAGDVLIFTEALTHGTMPWTNDAWERRAVLLKYSPYFMQWNVYNQLDESPGLTERQRKLLRGEYAWDEDIAKPTEVAAAAK